MAKLTLNDVANLENQTSAVAIINSNNTLTETALENTLSRDGTTPNTMLSNLDMNSNKIINLPAATTATEPVRFGEFQGAVTGALGLTTTGLVVAEANDSILTRTLTGTASEITVTNGSGVSGNPTVSLPAALDFTGKVVTGGTFNAITVGAPDFTVSDSLFVVQDNADNTKQLRFEVSGVTTGQTRTMTIPDASTTLVGTGTTQTLTNKTLTSPVIGTISNTGVLTLPTSTDTLVGRDTTDTLTNKTLTAPVISTISNSGTVTLPTGTRTLVARDTTDTLTNKTLTTPVISSPTGIVKGDVGLGNVDNTSDATKNAAAVTLTNKIINGSNNTFSNVANGSLASAAAWTLKGNASGASTSPLDITIAGLTHKSSPATSDLLMISDTSASAALKYSTIGEVVALASGGSSGSPGVVHMYWDGSAWAVSKPDGTVLSTAGTTTSGLQESIDYAQTNGYNLVVDGMGVTSAGTQPAVITCTTALTFGPALYRNYYIRNAYIKFDSFSGNAITLDTLQNCTLHIDAMIARSGGSAGDAVVLVYPHSIAPLYSGKVFQHNDIRLQGVTMYGSKVPIGACVAFAWATNYSVVNNSIHLGSLDCGANLADYCIQVNTPAASNAFNDNKITWTLLASWNSSGIINGTGTSAGVNAANFWSGSMESFHTGTAAAGISTYALYDTWQITSIDINGGVLTNGIVFNSGANYNYFVIPEIIASTTSVSDSGTGNIGHYNGKSHPPKPAFSAHKNGTNQTGLVSATYTQATFGTELFDIGGYFATNAWTPPAGLVSLQAAFISSGTWSAGTLCAIAIYKNGSPFKYGGNASSTNQGGAGVSITDRATGSDVYTVYASQTTTSGTATLDGTASTTYFMGEWLGPL